MKHIRILFPFCIVLCACAVLITSSTTETSAARKQQQLAQRDDELDRVFRKRELVRLDTRSVAERVRQTGQVSFNAAGKAYELVLMPNDLRAKDYHAEETIAGGIRRAVESGAVRTYKGFVRGIADSHARFTIDEKSFEGMILTPSANYFIEPAGKFSAAAATDDFVLYDERDVIERASLSCEVPMPEKISAKSAEFAPRVAGGQLQRVIELATEADAPFVATFNNDSAATNADILATMNQVEGVYQIQLGMTFNITYQHTWVGTDPYGTPASAALLLTSGNPPSPTTFRGYWNANFPHTSPQFRRDIAHLWTGRFPTAGISVIGVVCNNPTAAYGLSGKVAPPFTNLQRYILTAHEIGHNFSASHADGQAGCDNTIMIASASEQTALSFCQFSISQILNHVAANPTCLSLRTSQTRFDFDGDAKADLSVFRPNGSFWYIIGSEQNNFTGQAFGTQGDIIAPEDYDGDGRTDLGVFRPSTGSWYLLQSRAGFAGVQFGTQGDIPVAQDYDGDDKADIALYRPSTGAWYILNSNGNTVSSYFFGIQGDLPAPADFDTDGRADIAVFRPSTGTWYIQQSLLGFRAESFGANGDRPVPADFDGDDKADLAIFRPSTGGWYIQQSGAGFRGQLFGNSLDIPVAADYDGDRRADIAVWRTTTGEWYILNSSNATIRGQSFGTIGDQPVPAAYVP
jgi:Reprolysin family propeptide./Reprolysin (M12B) family zinc metalloprotease.